MHSYIINVFVCIIDSLRESVTYKTAEVVVTSSKIAKKSVFRVLHTVQASSVSWLWTICHYVGLMSFIPMGRSIHMQGQGM